MRKVRRDEPTAVVGAMVAKFFAFANSLLPTLYRRSLSPTTHRWLNLNVCLLSALQSCSRPFTSRGIKTSLVAVGYVQSVEHVDQDRGGEKGVLWWSMGNKFFIVLRSLCDELLR